MRELNMMLLLAAMLFAVPLFGLRAADAQQSGDGALASQLKAQADAWDIAIWTKDREAIAGNMSASFVQIDSDGNFADKAAFLDSIASAELTIAPYAVEDFKIRIYGDTAILTGSTRMQGTYKGEAFTSHFRFTDVYVKEDGAWRVANVQTTRIK